MENAEYKLITMTTIAPEALVEECGNNQYIAAGEWCKHLQQMLKKYQYPNSIVKRSVVYVTKANALMLSKNDPLPIEVAASIRGSGEELSVLHRMVREIEKSFHENE